MRSLASGRDFYAAGQGLFARRRPAVPQLCAAAPRRRKSWRRSTAAAVQATAQGAPRQEAPPGDAVPAAALQPEAAPSLQETMAEAGEKPIKLDLTLTYTVQGVCTLSTWATIEEKAYDTSFIAAALTCLLNIVKEREGALKRAVQHVHQHHPEKLREETWEGLRRVEGLQLPKKPAPLSSRLRQGRRAEPPPQNLKILNVLEFEDLLTLCQLLTPEAAAAIEEDMVQKAAAMLLPPLPPKQQQPAAADSGDAAAAQGAGEGASGAAAAGAGGEPGPCSGGSEAAPAGSGEPAAAGGSSEGSAAGSDEVKKDLPPPIDPEREDWILRRNALAKKLLEPKLWETWKKRMRTALVLWARQQPPPAPAAAAQPAAEQDPQGQPQEEAAPPPPAPAVLPGGRPSAPLHATMSLAAISPDDLPMTHSVRVDLWGPSPRGFRNLYEALYTGETAALEPAAVMLFASHHVVGPLLIMREEQVVESILNVAHTALGLLELDGYEITFPRAGHWGARGGGRNGSKVGGSSSSSSSSGGGKGDAAAAAVGAAPGDAGNAGGSFGGGQRELELVAHALRSLLGLAEWGAGPPRPGSWHFTDSRVRLQQCGAGKDERYRLQVYPAPKSPEPPVLDLELSKRELWGLLDCIDAFWVDHPHFAPLAVKSGGAGEEADDGAEEGCGASAEQRPWWRRVLPFGG